MKRYTTRDFKYEADSPMARLQELENKVEDREIVEVSNVIKKFVKCFEMYIGDCTFTMGQTNDIQYALKKAAEDVKGMRR